MCEAEYNISVIWSTDDVKLIAPDLTYHEMCQVLDAVADNHDGNYGISWETLRTWADEIRSERD